MTEKELIGKIEQLRQIKPRKDWVLSNKVSLLGKDTGFVFFPYFKPALAGLVCVFAFVGLFGFS